MTAGTYPAGDGPFRRDLARVAASAGIAEATGEVLWRDAGSAYGCVEDAQYAPVRCRSRGVATIRIEDRNSFEGLDVTVEGFDPATGKTTWAVPLGASTTLVDYDASRVVAGPTQLVVDSASDRVVGLQHGIRPLSGVRGGRVSGVRIPGAKRRQPGDRFVDRCL